MVRKNHALRAETTTPRNPGVLNEALKAAERLCPHDFVVALVTNQQHIEAVFRGLLGFQVDLGDERARRVDCRQPAIVRLLAHRGAHAVGAEQAAGEWRSGGRG